MTQPVDVLVVGAGPAGTALATHLARAGSSVLLVDRKRFPRDKPCGEFLSPACEPLLAELGVADALGQAGTRQVHGMELHGFGVTARGRFRLAPRLPAVGFGIRRLQFDDLLLRNALREPGIEWCEAHQFRGLLRDGSGRVIGASLLDPDRQPRDVKARWVVGADGVRSRVAASLGLQRPVRWLDRFALVAHFDPVPQRELAEVHFVPGGYFAATGVGGDCFSLNLVVDRSELTARRGSWPEFLAEHLQHAPLLAQRLTGAKQAGPIRGIGPLAMQTTRQVGAGFALVGDAAGYVDPLTGEGIYFALWTARLLASALQQALREPKAARSAMRRYQRQRRAELGPRLFLAKLLQRGLRHPRLAAACMRWLALHPRCCDLVVTLTGDTLHPRDLLRPSVLREVLGRSA